MTRSVLAIVVMLVAHGAVGAEQPLSEDGLVACWDFDQSLQEQAGATRDELSGRTGEPRFVSPKELPGTVG